MGKTTKGGISKKIIHGKTYYYYQWYEDGKRRSRTVSEEEVRQIQEGLSTPFSYVAGEQPFAGIYVLTGTALLTSLKSIEGYRERFCIEKLKNYVNSPINGKLFALYGLRRTGKTTLMLQTIASMDDPSSCAFITCSNGATIVQLNATLKKLIDSGARNIFIDEVTAMEDFIDGSAFLADVYARLAHIVLSGTDSLGFYLSSRNALYDRAILLHTTYISFKEFSYILDIHDIDQYIEYGGTFIHEGVNYHSDNVLEYGAYTDTAIVKNIQHSLEHYHDGSGFDRLKAHYERNDLTNLINKAIQDQTHRFIRSVLERRFKSQDYGSLKQLILKRRHAPELIEFIENVNEEKLYADLMDALDIIDNAEPFDDEDIEEMKRYLKIIDVIDEIPNVNIESGATSNQIIFTQPGLRYSQCRELIEAIFKQEAFHRLSAASSAFLIELLTEDIKGKMLEEIVLLDQKQRSLSPFKASFLAGEFDMAAYDKVTNTSQIYEIKHSKEQHPLQRRFLLDDPMCALFSKRFGQIIKKTVLYRGKETSVDGIQYINVEQYLLRE